MSLIGTENKMGSSLFLSFVSNEFSSSLYTLIFILLATIITAFGISKGIERFSKFAVPLLLIMLPVLAICTLSLPNAGEAVLEMLKFPTEITAMEVAEIFASAGEQMFFSLSLGVGCMICYGSFLNRNVNIPKSSAIIALADTSVALLAALTVLPVGAMLGQGESDGSMLLFVSMQKVFDSYHLWGHMFGVLFYILLLLVALSSAVSMLEVSMSLTGESENRKASAIFSGIAVSIPAILIARDGMGFGNFSEIFGMNLMALAEFLSQAILMPLSAILMLKAMRKAENESMLRRQLGGTSGSIIVVLLRYLALPTTVMVIIVKVLELLDLNQI